MPNLAEHCKHFTMKLFLALVFLATACSHVTGTVAPTAHAASVKKSATPASSALTLRVRLTDGTVKRVQAAPGDSIEDVCSQVFLCKRRA
jgi:hypothetical protein